MTIFKYPKDIVRGFFNFFKPDWGSIGSWIFIPIWLLGRLIEILTNFKIYDNDDLSEKPYKSTKNLKFDFNQGKKYILANTDSNKIKETIDSFLGFSYANIKLNDFVIESNSPALI